MKLTISPTIKKQITRNRAQLAVSEKEYIEKALVHYDQLLTLNAQLQEELSLWDSASSIDFGVWAQKQRA